MRPYARPWPQRRCRNVAPSSLAHRPHGLSGGPGHDPGVAGLLRQRGPARHSRRLRHRPGLRPVGYCGIHRHPRRPGPGSRRLRRPFRPAGGLPVRHRNLPHRHAVPDAVADTGSYGRFSCAAGPGHRLPVQHGTRHRSIHLSKPPPWTVHGLYIGQPGLRDGCFNPRRRPAGSNLRMASGVRWAHPPDGAGAGRRIAGRARPVVAPGIKPAVRRAGRRAGTGSAVVPHNRVEAGAVHRLDLTHRHRAAGGDSRCVGGADQDRNPRPVHPCCRARCCDSVPFKPPRP